MKKSKTKTIIEQSLCSWLNLSPESYHPRDMERFYIFVKNVCRYGRKFRDSEWLRSEMHKKGFQREFIDEFAFLFERLQDFTRLKRS